MVRADKRDAARQDVERPVREAWTRTQGNALVSETNPDYAVSSMVTVGVSYSGQTGRRASDNAFKGHVDVSF